jgi:L-iditol 2-dehydrogenase
MGQMHVLLAREFGAQKIIGVDMVPYRLEKALEFWADYIIDVSMKDLTDEVRRITKGMMANTVIVGPNSADAMKQGLATVAPGGTVLFFTPARPGELLTFDPNDLYFKDVRISTSYSCGPDDTREALLLIQKGMVTAKKLVSHRFAIGDTEKAYRLTAEAKTSLKSLIVF